MAMASRRADRNTRQTEEPIEITRSSTSLRSCPTRSPLSSRVNTTRKFQAASLKSSSDDPQRQPKEPVKQKVDVKDDRSRKTAIKPSTRSTSNSGCLDQCERKTRISRSVIPRSNSHEKTAGEGTKKVKKKSILFSRTRSKSDKDGKFDLKNKVDVKTDDLRDQSEKSDSSEVKSPKRSKSLIQRIKESPILRRSKSSIEKKTNLPKPIPADDTLDLRNPKPASPTSSPDKPKDNKSSSFRSRWKSPIRLSFKSPKHKRRSVDSDSVFVDDSPSSKSNKFGASSTDVSEIKRNAQENIECSNGSNPFLILDTAAESVKHTDYCKVDPVEPFKADGHGAFGALNSAEMAAAEQTDKIEISRKDSVRDWLNSITDNDEGGNAGESMEGVAGQSGPQTNGLEDDLFLGADAKTIYGDNNEPEATLDSSPKAPLDPDKAEPLPLPQRKMSGHKRFPLYNQESFNSVDTQNTQKTFESLDQILQDRKGDPEEILTNLGFGSSQAVSNLATRIPDRFLVRPSKAQGINIDDFLGRNPELKEFVDLQKAMGEPLIKEETDSGENPDLPKPTPVSPSFYNVAKTVTLVRRFGLPRSRLVNTSACAHQGLTAQGTQYTTILNPENSKFLERQGIYDEQSGNRKVAAGKWGSAFSALRKKQGGMFQRASDTVAPNIDSSNFLTVDMAEDQARKISCPERITSRSRSPSPLPYAIHSDPHTPSPLDRARSPLPYPVNAPSPIHTPRSPRILFRKPNKLGVTNTHDTSMDKIPTPVFKLSTEHVSPEQEDSVFKSPREEKDVSIKDITQDAMLKDVNQNSIDKDSDALKPTVTDADHIRLAQLRDRLESTDNIEIIKMRNQELIKNLPDRFILLSDKKKRLSCTSTSKSFDCDLDFSDCWDETADIHVDEVQDVSDDSNRLRISRISPLLRISEDRSDSLEECNREIEGIFGSDLFENDPDVHNTETEQDDIIIESSCVDLLTAESPKTDNVCDNSTDVQTVDSDMYHGARPKTTRPPISNVPDINVLDDNNDVAFDSLNVCDDVKDDLVCDEPVSADNNQLGSNTEHFESKKKRLRKTGWHFSENFSHSISPEEFQESRTSGLLGAERKTHLPNLKDCKKDMQSFELEEVQSSDMVLDELPQFGNSERLPTRGPLSRTGSTQSDSSGFAESEQIEGVTELEWEGLKVKHLGSSAESESTVTDTIALNQISRQTSNNSQTTTIDTDSFETYNQNYQLQLTPKLDAQPDNIRQSNVNNKLNTERYLQLQKDKSRDLSDFVLQAPPRKRRKDSPTRRKDSLKRNSPITRKESTKKTTNSPINRKDSFQRKTHSPVSRKDPVKRNVDSQTVYTSSLYVDARPPKCNTYKSSPSSSEIHLYVNNGDIKQVQTSVVAQVKPNNDSENYYLKDLNKSTDSAQTYRTVRRRNTVRSNDSGYDSYPSANTLDKELQQAEEYLRQHGQSDQPHSSEKANAKPADGNDSDQQKSKPQQGHLETIPDGNELCTVDDLVAETTARLCASHLTNEVSDHRLLYSILKQSKYFGPRVEGMQSLGTWPVFSRTIATSRPQLLEEVRLMEHALHKYKVELRTLEVRALTQYKQHYDELTPESREALKTTNQLRKDVMKEIEEMEYLLTKRKKAILGGEELLNTPSPSTDLAGLNIIAQMIDMLKEQMYHSNIIQSMGELPHQHPLLQELEDTSSEHDQTMQKVNSHIFLDQLTNLQQQMVAQQTNTRAVVQGSMKELKDVLLEEIRQSIHAETQVLRHQVLAAETELTELKRQMSTSSRQNTSQDIPTDVSRDSS